jgi:magnesium transporter
VDERDRARMLTITVYGPAGPRVASRDELAALLGGEDGQWVWADIVAPTDDDAELLEKQFGFHRLAIEDTRNQRQRPKIQDYGDHVFLIVNPIEKSEASVAFRELDIFIADNRLVTVHAGDEPVITAARRRVAGAGPAHPPTPGYALYAIVDIAVDGYFPVLDEIGADVDDVEEKVLDSPDRSLLAQLFKMKRDLIAMRKVIGPQRDMFNTLMRHDLDFLDSESLQYQLRDVYDHLLRATDILDTTRDLLSNIIDLYLSAVSYQLNKVVNRLTALTMIIGVLAVITGFFGMNLPLPWPSREASSATMPILALMAASVAGLLGLFRFLRWL